MKKMLVLLNTVALYLGVGGEDPFLGKVINDLDLASRSFLGPLSMLLFGCSLVGFGLVHRRKRCKRPSN